MAPNVGLEREDFHNFKLVVLGCQQFSGDNVHRHPVLVKYWADLETEFSTSSRNIPHVITPKAIKV